MCCLGIIGILFKNFIYIMYKSSQYGFAYNYYFKLINLQRITLLKLFLN